MKKLLSLSLVLVISLTCFVFASCDLFDKEDKKDDDITGTYEMTDISGTVQYQGQTIPLSTSLYEYYRITLEEDGNVIIEAKGSNGVDLKEEGTWKLDGEVLSVTSVRGGYTVVEKMELKDGVITYSVPSQYDSLTGMTISMTIVLEK